MYPSASPTPRRRRGSVALTALLAFLVVALLHATTAAAAMAPAAAADPPAGLLLAKRSPIPSPRRVIDAVGRALASRPDDELDIVANRVADDAENADDPLWTPVAAVPARAARDGDAPSSSPTPTDASAIVTSKAGRDPDAPTPAPAPTTADSSSRPALPSASPTSPSLAPVVTSTHAANATLAAAAGTAANATVLPLTPAPPTAGRASTKSHENAKVPTTSLPKPAAGNRAQRTPSASGAAEEDGTVGAAASGSQSGETATAFAPQSPSATVVVSAIGTMLVVMGSAAVVAVRRSARGAAMYGKGADLVDRLVALEREPVWLHRLVQDGRHAPPPHGVAPIDMVVAELLKVPVSQLPVLRAEARRRQVASAAAGSRNATNNRSSLLRRVLNPVWGVTNSIAPTNAAVPEKSVPIPLVTLNSAPGPAPKSTTNSPPRSAGPPPVLARNGPVPPALAPIELANLRRRRSLASTVLLASQASQASANHLAAVPSSPVSPPPPQPATGAAAGDAVPAGRPSIERRLWRAWRNVKLATNPNAAGRDDSWSPSRSRSRSRTRRASLASTTEEMDSVADADNAEPAAFDMRGDPMWALDDDAPPVPRLARTPAPAPAPAPQPVFYHRPMGAMRVGSDRGSMDTEVSETYKQAQAQQIQHQLLRHRASMPLGPRTPPSPPLGDDPNVVLAEYGPVRLDRGGGGAADFWPNGRQRSRSLPSGMLRYAAYAARMKASRPQPPQHAEACIHHPSHPQAAAEAAAEAAAADEREVVDGDGFVIRAPIYRLPGRRPPQLSVSSLHHRRGSASTGGAQTEVTSPVAPTTRRAPAAIAIDTTATARRRSLSFSAAMSGLAAVDPDADTDVEQLSSIAIDRASPLSPRSPRSRTHSRTTSTASSGVFPGAAHQRRRSALWNATNALLLPPAPPMHPEIAPAVEAAVDLAGVFPRRRTSGVSADLSSVIVVLDADQSTMMMALPEDAYDSDDDDAATETSDVECDACNHHQELPPRSGARSPATLELDDDEEEVEWTAHQHHYHPQHAAATGVPRSMSLSPPPVVARTLPLSALSPRRVDGEDGFQF
ncbi:hypothetical protein H9P43_004321 [Blastocladiella emersonii ATCC 22665]|nr:hypothetical protein H9P43_004321 [Blastocladiella emersonii ATCC 22665]